MRLIFFYRAVAEGIFNIFKKIKLESIREENRHFVKDESACLRALNLKIELSWKICILRWMDTYSYFYIN